MQVEECLAQYLITYPLRMQVLLFPHFSPKIAPYLPEGTPKTSVAVRPPASHEKRKDIAFESNGTNIECERFCLLEAPHPMNNCSDIGGYKTKRILEAIETGHMSHP